MAISTKWMSWVSINTKQTIRMDFLLTDVDKKEQGCRNQARGLKGGIPVDLEAVLK